MFGLNNQLVVTFKEENMMALKYLFVKGYSGADEDDYCAAVYTQQDAYESLSFVLDQVRVHRVSFCFSVMTNTLLFSLSSYWIWVFIPKVSEWGAVDVDANVCV